MNEDLEGTFLAEVLEKLEKGKIGHRAAMEWLHVRSDDDLVDVMHVNGRLMPGHQPMRVSPETRAGALGFAPDRLAENALPTRSSVALPYLADRGLVLKPDLDWCAGYVRRQRCGYMRSEVF